jgi:hypothetical protein
MTSPDFLKKNRLKHFCPLDKLWEALLFNMAHKWAKWFFDDNGNLLKYLQTAISKYKNCPLGLSLLCTLNSIISKPKLNAVQSLKWLHKNKEVLKVLRKVIGSWRLWFHQWISLLTDQNLVMNYWNSKIGRW